MAKKPKPKQPSFRSTSSTTASAPVPTGPYAPFTPVPSEADLFVENLARKAVYLTHIDTTATELKRSTFVLAASLNGFIACFILLRLWSVFPFYLSLIAGQEIAGQDAAIPFMQMSWADVVAAIGNRWMTFVFDGFMLGYIAPWPWHFFVRARIGAPAQWRWTTRGFREREIVVRVSRGWGADDLRKDLEQQQIQHPGSSAVQESTLLTERLLPALDRRLLANKTGYLLIDANWDLEFNTMQEATRLVDSGRLLESSLQKSVWWYQEGYGWCVWAVHALDEGAGGTSRAAIVQFKDKLTAQGHESLFFRWIELVQYESSQPGGFTEERQANAVKQARELFRERGVDFDEFVESIGGLQQVPGLEKSS